MDEPSPNKTPLTGWPSRYLTRTPPCSNSSRATRPSRPPASASPARCTSPLS